MATYGLKKSFNIDNGELDQLRRNECFVLGYELGSIDELLKLPAAFAKPVHPENQERVNKSCVDSGREFSLKWMAGDASESWLQLIVETA